MRLTRNTCLSSPDATPFAYIHLRYAPAATCKYHPSGNTSCSFINHLQKKCKYRPGGVETKLLRRPFKVKKMEGCDSARVSHENSQNGFDLLREGRWAGIGQQNAVLMTRERLFAWTSTPWWKNTKALNMRVDPYNQISWKHKLDWQPGLCVGQEPF